MEALPRSLDGAACDCLHQMAWIQKDETGIDDELWSLLKVHRKSAKKRIERSDNQIRDSTVSLGWHTFQLDEESEDWKDPYEYPRVAIAIDLGGDCLCAANALLYKYDVNAWVFPDFSHIC